MKRIYSLNLIAYLRSVGFKEEVVAKDEVHGKVYYSFGESDEVTQAIATYKNPKAEVKLHDFITNFKNIKREIYEFQKNNA